MNKLRRWIRREIARYFERKFHYWLPYANEKLTLYPPGSIGNKKGELAFELSRIYLELWNTFDVEAIAHE